MSSFTHWDSDNKNSNLMKFVLKVQHLEMVKTSSICINDYIPIWCLIYCYVPGPPAPCHFQLLLQIPFGKKRELISFGFPSQIPSVFGFQDTEFDSIAQRRRCASGLTILPKIMFGGRNLGVNCMTHHSEIKTNSGFYLKDSSSYT